MELFIDPLTSKLLVAIIAGTIISGLSAIGAAQSWGWKKFLYTLGLTTISALAVVDVVEGGAITGDNAISVFLEIIGASFIANKLFSIGDRLKGIVKK